MSWEDERETELRSAWNSIRLPSLAQARVIFWLDAPARWSLMLQPGYAHESTVLLSAVGEKA
jgi:hypothetical protein